LRTLSRSKFCTSLNSKSMVDPQAILTGDKRVYSKLQSGRRDNSKAGVQKLPD
jgi:hypothetical protein